MNTIQRLFAITVLASALGGCAGTQAPPAASGKPAAAAAPVKVVYHVSNGVDEAQRAMANIRNHLAADPTAKIVVVGNANGVEFLLDGARDSKGNSFDASILELQSKGVEFRACENTMANRNIDKSRLVSQVKTVPSGVVEVARLQAQEGYAYLRP